MTAQRKVIPVSTRALVQRIRRILARKAQYFHVTRGNREGLGDYYLTDSHNHVVGPWIFDLEKYGRKLGALRPWESLKS